MNISPLKKASSLLAAGALAAGLLAPQALEAQLVFSAAIPDLDPAGNPLAGANTTLADGSGLFQPAPDAARSDDWTWRPTLGNNGLLNSLGPTSSTGPANTNELVTTITGLTPFLETPVYALFYSNIGSATSLWGVRAGLNYADELRTNPWYTETSPEVVLASSLGWSSPPGTFTSNVGTLLAADLGTATADENGHIRVFIHDFPTADANFRTWYDGVAVVPEPSTYALFAGLGVLFFGAVRRWRRSSR